MPLYGRSWGGRSAHETSTIMDDKIVENEKEDKLRSRAYTHIEISMQIFSYNLRISPKFNFLHVAERTDIHEH